MTDSGPHFTDELLPFPSQPAAERVSFAATVLSSGKRPSPRTAWCTAGKKSCSFSPLMCAFARIELHRLARSNQAHFPSPVPDGGLGLQGSHTHMSP
ncbi:hypothetical protein J6590_047108 [Homalodisca vitripennis]|nr:hypothetical protein J6590_047108 [Homalodisca vitripennis]